MRDRPSLVVIEHVGAGRRELTGLVDGGVWVPVFPSKIECTVIGTSVHSPEAPPDYVARSRTPPARTVTALAARRINLRRLSSREFASANASVMFSASAEAA